MKQTIVVYHPHRITRPLSSLSPVRLYSYPIPKLFGSSFAVGTPGDDCRNVVARLIAGTTAPVGFAADGESSDDDDDDVVVAKGSSMWR